MILPSGYYLIDQILHFFDIGVVCYVRTVVLRLGFPLHMVLSRGLNYISTAA